MSDQITNGVVAIVLGVLLAVALLVPTVAVRYRRRGAFGPGELITLVTAAVYGLALWTYTLLPFPAQSSWKCLPWEWNPLSSIRPIWQDDPGGVSGLLHNEAFQQIGLNVLFFLPLGFFVRLIARRGIFTTTLLGFLISLAIETTQGTGVWGIFRCAYRLFDVDDLLTNTAGALLGGILAWVLVQRRRRPSYHPPTRITLGRRWMGFFCDALMTFMLGASAVVAWQGWQAMQNGGRAPVAGTTTLAIQVAVPLIVEAACVLCAGRTIGEWAVAVRTTAGFFARIIKLVFGVGGYVAIEAAPSPITIWATLALVVVTLALSIGTRGHRGLTGLLSRSELVISTHQHSDSATNPLRGPKTRTESGYGARGAS